MSKDTRDHRAHYANGADRLVITGRFPHGDQTHERKIFVKPGDIIPSHPNLAETSADKE